MGQIDPDLAILEFGKVLNFSLLLFETLEDVFCLFELQSVPSQKLLRFDVSVNDFLSDLLEGLID